MDSAIISTLLGSSAGTLLIREAIAYGVRRRQRARENKAREESWLNMIRRYADPLKLAARNLAVRLSEFHSRECRRYFANDAPDNEFYEYKRLSTIYRLAALLGWIRAFRRERSYLDPRVPDTMKSIEAIECVLADGQEVEVARLDSLLKLWKVEPESIDGSRANLAAALDTAMQKYLADHGVTSAGELVRQAEDGLVSACARAISASCKKQDYMAMVERTTVDAVGILATTEAYIYRDWQAAIGDLMIRETQKGERRFEIIGYGEFEAMCEDQDRRDAQRWIERLRSLFVDSGSAAGEFDAREVQLQELEKACDALADYLERRYSAAQECGRLDVMIAGLLFTRRTEGGGTS